MALQLVFIGLGFWLIVFPIRTIGPLMKRQNDRLEELKNGADESYFEERRELKAYPSNAVWRTRLMGFALVIIATAQLLGG